MWWVFETFGRNFRSPSMNHGHSRRTIYENADIVRMHRVIGCYGDNPVMPLTISTNFSDDQVIDAINASFI